ncbi:MAG TPA: S9 family peptidase, partial [Panacibacter sp.]|nr:S9 family peptidase [Panacibacter sp.]
LHVIYTGDKEVQSLQISPDARFITYVLYEKPANKKNTIVPSYVTENGFTTDIETRPKAGAPQGKYTLFVFDRMRDTVIAVKTDSLEGITNQPDYVKDYPQKFKDQQPALREVVIQGLYWNETGSAAVVDILSQDFKDRWLMQLDTATAKLKTIDHQRDEAWIAGPGIAWLGASVNGWINDHTF